MGIGYRELMILIVMLVFMVLIVAGIVWLIGTASKSSKVPMRGAAERLAELEALKKAEHITAAEYEKQRAVILSGV